MTVGEYRFGEHVNIKSFWRGVAAEFIGTAIIVFVGCGSMLVGNFDSAPYYPPMDQPEKSKLFLASKTIKVAFAFGFTVASATWCAIHHSGANFNPAITIGMLAAGRISVVRTIFYIISQIAGSLFGTSFLFLCLPKASRGLLGATVLGNDISASRGAVIELAITFVLVLVYFASTDEHRQHDKGSIPLTIGIAVTACHLFAFPLTTCSMNPARSFGPAVFGQYWKDHWIYWAGPVIGGMCASLLYKLALASVPMRRELTTMTECPIIITTAADDSVQPDPFVPRMPIAEPVPVANESGENETDNLLQNPTGNNETISLQIVSNIGDQDSDAQPSSESANVAQVTPSIRPETPPAEPSVAVAAASAQPEGQESTPEETTGDSSCGMRSESPDVIGTHNDSAFKSVSEDNEEAAGVDSGCGRHSIAEVESIAESDVTTGNESVVNVQRRLFPTVCSGSTVSTACAAVHCTSSPALSRGGDSQIVHIAVDID